MTKLEKAINDMGQALPDISNKHGLTHIEALAAMSVATGALQHSLYKQNDEE